MRNYGDFALSSVVRGTFNTRTAAGVPVDLASGALSVYKDGSATESTAGVTLTVPYDSRTGLALFAIDTSADGSFYSTGSDFRVVITTGTVDSVSVVGVEVGSFSLNNRSLQSRIPAALQSGRMDSYTGAMGTDVVNAASLNADAVTEIQNGLATSAALAVLSGFVDTEVAAIKAKTDNLPIDPADASDIAASFASLSSSLATLTGYVDTEVAAIKAKTDNLPADPADASDIAASFSTVNNLLAAIAAYIDTEVSAIKAKTDALPAAPASTGDVTAAVADLPTNAELATALAAADDAVLAAIAAEAVKTASIATEVGKIPRSATAKAAGAAVTKTNTSVSPEQTLTETIT